MRIFTFFDCTPGLPHQGELIRQWRDSWQRRGWDPFLLNPRTYVKHRYYKDFRKLVGKVDDPILRCELLRWLALDTIGGGWFSEYDVINYGPPNHPVRKGWRHARAHYGLALVYLPRGACRKIVRLLLGGADQSRAFYDAGVYIDCWPDIHREFSECGWETAETVHFSTRELEDNGIVVPKYRLIENCGRTI